VQEAQCPLAYKAANSPHPLQIQSILSPAHGPQIGRSSLSRPISGRTCEQPLHVRDSFRIRV
jgi:hypothetical protein